MSDLPIHTWRELLLPNGQDTTVHFSEVATTGVCSTTPSAFIPHEWGPNRHPSGIRLVNGLPSMMHRHLRQILDTHFPSEAARTHFTAFGAKFSPENELAQLRSTCMRTLEFNSQYGASVIAEHVSEMVKRLYYALSGTNVAFDPQVPTKYGEVITDRVYRDQHEIKVLWDDKAPAVFDRFIEPLQEQITTHESVPGLWSEPSSVTFDGYEAILSKLTYHATDVQPRVRWGIIFSTLKYMVIYMPRSAENILYCSDIMTFCVGPGNQQGHQAAEQSPPLWSLVIYMLLTERFDVDDNTLRQKFDLPVPLGDPGPSSSSLGSRYNVQGCRQWGQLETTTKTDESSHYSGRLTKAPGSMNIRCFNGILMQLTLVGMSHYDRSDERPLIHFDRQLDAGWSSVYASSKSDIIIKFGTIPRKDKAEVKWQLKNEIAAYGKLGQIAGWVVPQLYGEYEWYGGRALMMTNGGPSLEAFTSLCLIQRVVLFCELYLIHRCGVEHRDFVPRNIVQKRGLYLKIIDFGFSNTDHVCPGWNVCMELQFAWRELLLDRVTSPFQHWMPGWFGLREVGNMNYYPTLLFTVGVILLAFIIVVIPTN